MARLKDLRAHRDEAAVQEALAEITKSVQTWADGGKNVSKISIPLSVGRR